MSRYRFGQSGGTLLGLIVGLLVGLGVALAIALYVSKVPIPFVDKLPQRTPEQDSAEAQRNKDWNPNAPLATRAGAPPSSPASGPSEATATPSGASAKPAAPASAPTRQPADKRPEVTGLFIQAGAYSKPEEAEQQRARLAMLGFSARISERDQGGRIVYRVRLGPFETREETQGPMDRLQAAGIEVSLVKVERGTGP